MRIASVLGQGLASAARVGREPDSGALVRPAGHCWWRRLQGAGVG